MTEAVVASTHLSADEIDELCTPIRQRFAQMRYLCALLGVESLPRRPDGLPLVGRKLVEERLNTAGDHDSPAGFNWTK